MEPVAQLDMAHLKRDIEIRQSGEQIVRRPSKAQLLHLLQRRLARLVAASPGKNSRDSSDSDSVQTLQDAMVEVVRKLNRPGWVAYLVGGTLRDLLVGPIDGDVQPRDIDIIVEGATREQLQKVLQKHLVLERFTRFGGLHLSRSLTSGSRLQFDIWTLADTWGFQSKKIVPRIEDFPGTTFLNIDSCATELIQTDKKQRKLFEKGFFESIANRVLDMNYAPNPYPYVCVARALVLAAQLDFAIARALAEFILHHTAAGGIDALIEAQLSHYGAVRCETKELKEWIHEIRRRFDSGQHTISIDVPHSRRLELWSNHAATDTVSNT